MSETFCCSFHLVKFQNDGTFYFWQCSRAPYIGRPIETVYCFPLAFNVIGDNKLEVVCTTFSYSMSGEKKTLHFCPLLPANTGTSFR